MADDPKAAKAPDASVNINDRRAETRSAQPLVQSPTADSARPADPADDQPMVMVKPIASYTDSALGEFKTPDSEPYGVSRQRAAELRVNMLVEYVNDSDETAAVEAQVKAAADRKREEIEARTKPAGAKSSAADAAKAKAPPAGSHPPIKTAV